MCKYSSDFGYFLSVPSFWKVLRFPTVLLNVLMLTIVSCIALYSLTIPCVSGTVSITTAPSALPMLGGFAPVPPPTEVDRSKLSAIKTRIYDAVACQPAVIYRLSDELDCSGLIPVSVQQAVKYADGKSP